MSGDTLFIQRNRTATRTVSRSFTRPADTVAYASGDVVNNSTTAPVIMTFSGMSREPGRGGTIQSAVLTMSSVASLAAELDLYLFDTAPVMQNDNAVWSPSDTEIQALVAVISFYSVQRRTSANNVQYVAGTLGQSYTCTPTSTNLFGLLVARNGYVPASSEQFTVRLMAIVD